MTNLVEPPVIKSVDIQVKLRGKYKTKTGEPKGLVVHFTAGRNRKGHEDAISCLNNMAYNGLGCLVMATDGTIFRAANQRIDDVAYHAGESKFNSVKGLSNYCIGMEICCAGVLLKKDNKFISWFKEQYYPDEVRFITEKKDNQWPGYYHKFTEEQEKALIQFCLWQKSINEEFSFDWVVGHDEIAVPIGRKKDPGGSLSMTMQEFRNKLKAML